MRLDLSSLTAVFVGIVGYTIVALPLTQDGPIHREALEALSRFIGEHAEEAMNETSRSETRIAQVLPDLSVPQEDALRSTGEFLLAARRWLDDACKGGEEVWRRDADPGVENVLADAVMSAR